MSEPTDNISASRIDTMPDWKCSFCEAVSPSNAISCSKCHKLREESDAHYFEMLSHDDLKTVHPHPEHSTFSFPPETVVSRFQRIKSSIPARVAAIVAAAIAICVCAWLIFKPSPPNNARYKVADVRWERTIMVERYASKTKVNPKLKSYSPFRTVKLEGKDNSPKWPNPELGKSAEGKPDKEGKKTESYIVRLERIAVKSNLPKNITLSTSETEFQNLFTLGKEINLDTDSKGNIAKISKDSLVQKTSK